MINLRYHIVSLTAVFLALGLGMTMGSTLLDRATVDSLNNQLDNLEGDLDNRDQRIDELEGELDVLRSRRDLLEEEGLGPLVEDELTGVPVIVFAVRGTNEALVDRALDALSAAGANVDGAWWLTDRFVLDDGAERRDLAAALGITTDLESRLRRTVAQRLSGTLLDRLLVMEPVGERDGEGAGEATSTTGQSEEGPGPDPEPDGTTSPTTAPAGEPTEAEYFTALRESGFVEFQPRGDTGSDAPLPPADARLVLISDASADLTLDQLLLPLLDNLVSDGPVPVLLATGLPEGADESERGVVVDAVRTDDDLAERVSTLDDLDLFEGELGAVFVVEDMADGRLSHYGYAETASRLLPTREPSQ